MESLHWKIKLFFIWNANCVDFETMCFYLAFSWKRPVEIFICGLALFETHLLYKQIM